MSNLTIKKKNKIKIYHSLQFEEIKRENLVVQKLKYFT